MLSIQPLAPRHGGHDTAVSFNQPTEGNTMVKLALFVRLEARPGKEAAVADFLAGALPLANAEPGTRAWFALKFGPSTFGVFDAFQDEAGRQAHLSGPIAAALMANAAELLATPPEIERVDLLAAKLP
jgi:quinol monooxygenase YgiN